MVRSNKKKICFTAQFSYLTIYPNARGQVVCTKVNVLPKYYFTIYSLYFDMQKKKQHFFVFGLTLGVNIALKGKLCACKML